MSSTPLVSGSVTELSALVSRLYKTPGLTVYRVKQEVGRVMGIKETEMVAKYDRRSDIRFARKAVASVLRKSLGISFRQIGYLLGGLKHTTVEGYYATFETEVAIAADVVVPQALFNVQRFGAARSLEAVALSLPNGSMKQPLAEILKSLSNLSGVSYDDVRYADHFPTNEDVALAKALLAYHFIHVLNRDPRRSCWREQNMQKGERLVQAGVVKGYLADRSKS